MQPEDKDTTLETLREIRSIMDKSARFISLSGWSGIWAGATALAGACIAYRWMHAPDFRYQGMTNDASDANFDAFAIHCALLAAGVFVTAFAGGLFFTIRKAGRQGHTLWNNASRQLLLALFFPLFAGGAFTTVFVYYGCGMFIAPACLAFYGLALISASRHTLSDIRYLGMLEVALGCTNLFFPGFGLYFWAFGFGVLHILYGAIMWKKYDN